MRGFGAVQACFGHESQMDKLAAALGMDPLQLRLMNALKTGDRLPTGQKVHVPAPVRECLEAAAAVPLPGETGDNVAGYGLPGGAGRTADRSRIRRGIGFAVGYKNLAYSEGYDDDTCVRCRLECGKLTITCAVAEIGQGFVTIARQIAHEVLGVTDVLLANRRTRRRSVRPDLPRRVVRPTCRARRSRWPAGRLPSRFANNALSTGEVDAGELSLQGDRVRSDDGRIDVAVVDASGEPIEVEVQYSHRQTTGMDEETGQGDADVSWIFGAQRAVVDVDLDLGLVRVVQITTGQDVGKAINPLSVIGQVEGGVSQGLGLAVMEEVLSEEGIVQNGSFTDYLVPTFADMPPIEISLIEKQEDGAPFGAKGVGETPSLASTPAVVAAIRAATGLELPRVPVRPEDIALAQPGAPRQGRAID